MPDSMIFNFNKQQTTNNKREGGQWPSEELGTGPNYLGTLSLGVWSQD